jgi:class 3 adenylate cyclase
VRRLEPVDWLLIGTLLPICLYGVVMTVGCGLRSPLAQLPFTVSSAPSSEAYPVVRRVLTTATGDPPGLAAGDRVVRLGPDDLRGLSAAAFIRRSAAAAAGSRSLPFTIDRQGTRFERVVELVPMPPWWGTLPFVISLVGIALLLLVRAVHWHLARRFYAASLLVAIYATPYFVNPILAPDWMMIMAVLVRPLAYGLTLWNVQDFVPGARPRPWERALPWTIMLLASAVRIAELWLPDAGIGAVVVRARGPVGLGFVAALLAMLTRIYRHTDRLGRRQVKWGFYGFYVAAVPYAALLAVASLGETPWWANGLWVAASMAAIAIPVGLLIAVAFYQFLDIDRLFSATLAYSVVAVAALAVVLGVMPAAAQVASGALGMSPALGQALLAVGVAAVCVPLHGVVRPRIDRCFFAERVALQQGVAQLLVEMSSCTDTESLVRLVADRLDELLRPESTLLYARSGEVFAPMLVRGRTAPPAFDAHSTVVAALQARTTPLAAARWTQRHTTSLSAFERSALATLDVAVLMPIRRGSDLVAFSCLGAKRSGDIYTPTDLALLGAVAGQISERLLSLDAAALAEQAQAAQAALRRYVPGAVAERVASGRDMETGEREVTVLFVDIRGYTGFSEAREAAEIFHTVNAYTETVSRLVQSHGGSVVEFHGDGMLAVFGALEAVPRKERDAVEAARAIPAAIATLPAPDGGVRPGLSVGVGIATGLAFVGNIQSSDRFIWTVIGNTTNLAARLQSLTREFDAAVAIDDTTFERAGTACADFICRRDVPIRGRSQPVTVHTLPLR